MLIDGNSLAFRAFYALPEDLMTSSGQVTNAVVGFTAMLTNLIRDHEPDHIAVAFDLSEPTFRHKGYDSYKAGRKKTPDTLKQQLDIIKKLVGVLAIPALTKPGFEADDIIATLATKASDQGDDVVVVTGDRDSYQLVSDPHIKVLYNKRGVSDYDLYDEAGIEKRTGVKPNFYVEYAALRGDNSDNLPGVPGVGEKTAAKLINKYGGVSGIYDHIEDMTPKLRENLENNKENVERNLELMPLVCDLELDVTAEQLQIGGIEVQQVRELFDFLEAPRYYERLNEVLGFDDDPIVETQHLLNVKPIIASSVKQALEAIEELTSTDSEIAISGSLESESGLYRTTGLALGTKTWSLPETETGSTNPKTNTAASNANKNTDTTTVAKTLWLASELLENTEICKALNQALNEEENNAHTATAKPPRVIGHSIKALLRGLRPLCITAEALALDTEIAAYLLDPADTNTDVQTLLQRFANVELDKANSEALASTDTVTAAQVPISAEQLQLDFGQLDSNQADEIEIDEHQVELATAHGLKVAALLMICEPIEEALEQSGMSELNKAMEVPLVQVLADMEYIGVGVDKNELQGLHDSLETEARELREKIVELAGEDFNVNSAKQLQVILFEKLGLTPGRKTKTGYSTNAATLEKLRGDHPIVELLLTYREVEKLRSTYGVGLLAEIGPKDRIRATFNQTVARTGRLSSDKPNLHNIPVRSERGRRFRKAFIPEKPLTMLVADYNQIELRCIAHLSNDPGLIRAFEAGEDIHSATAAEVFGVPASEVDSQQRSKAKMVSYGLAYGMEAYGLAQRLGVPIPEAQEILDAYFAAFPALHKYMEDTVEEAKERGYTETLFGRRRKIPELKSSNRRIREAGERQAMNAGIQGLAADIFKVALVELDRAITAFHQQHAQADGQTLARVVLQVHDEVVLEVHPDHLDEIRDLVVQVMGAAFDLRVPLDVNLADGPSWAAAKG